MANEQGQPQSNQPESASSTYSDAIRNAAAPAAGARDKRIRVLVVDDSAFMRKAIVQLIESDPKLCVIDTAVNGEECIAKINEHKPDVVTLDLEMPVLNGHEALRRIRRECRTNPGGAPAVLVCSSLTQEGSRDALQAMREGAADVIAKDSSKFSVNMHAMRDDLVAKIKAVAAGRTRARLAALSPKKDLPPFESQPVSFAGAKIGLIAIGSSTGGPPVLEMILRQMPANLPCPIVVAQHMPVIFTKAISERLDETCQISVKHGEHGCTLLPGTAYIIPGGTHGHIAGNASKLTLEISNEPKTETYRPSANVLFATATRAVGRNCLGVVLTGMGEDGKQGGMKLIQAGGRILAQDPVSSVVYGMPRAAAEIGATPMIPEHIAQSLKTLVPFSARGGTNQAA